MEEEAQQYLEQELDRIKIIDNNAMAKIMARFTNIKLENLKRKHRHETINTNDRRQGRP